MSSPSSSISSRITSSQRPCSFRAARSSFGVHCRSNSRPAAACLPTAQPGCPTAQVGAPSLAPCRHALHRQARHHALHEACPKPANPGPERLSPVGSQYIASDDELVACSCTKDVGIFSKPARKQRLSAQPKARVTERYQREEKDCITRKGKREEERLSQMVGES